MRWTIVCAAVAAGLLLGPVGAGAAAARRPAVIPVVMGGDYQPIAGDFDGNGQTDILWYSPTAPDVVWLSGGGLPPASHRTVPVVLDGAYTPVVGNFDDRGGTDILWYRPSPGKSQLWIATGDANLFSHRTLSIRAGVTPIPATFFQDAPGDVSPSQRDIYWFSGQPGGMDQIWRGNDDGTFSELPKHPTHVGAIAVAGGFERGTGMAGLPDQILFYRPTLGTAEMVSFTDSGSPKPRTLQIPKNSQPILGDFWGKRDDGCESGQGDGYTDIVWYGRGRLPDTGWQFASDGSGHTTTKPYRQDGDLTPVVTEKGVIDIAEDCGTVDIRNSIVWYDPAKGSIGAITGLPKRAVLVSGDFNGNHSLIAPEEETPHRYGYSYSTDLLLYGRGNAPDLTLIDLA